jgi:parafibromin
MSSEDPAGAVQQWAQAEQLSHASLNEAGTELSKDGVTLSATTKVTVSYGDKTCDYSLASIFLQIVNPAQGLKDYRTACKQYHVKDPIKASDKTTILSFFLGSAAVETGAVVAAPEPVPPAPVEAVEDPAAPPVAAPAAAPAAPSDKHKSSSRDKDKDKDKERRSSKDKHRKDKRDRHDKKRGHSSSRNSEERKKKAPKTINTETLFSNLVTVVDKRSDSAIQKKEETAQLITALSTDGFDVTPDLLSKYRQATETIVANEIPVGNSASILKAAAGKDLSRILELYLEVMQPKSSKSSSGSSSLGQKKMWRSYLVGKKPIIIVPKGMTAPLTLLNAHEFFGNSRYIPRDVMMKKGVHKTNIPTNFSRRVGQRLGGGLVEYEIMDNPKSKLRTAKDWERVVAVVCLGQAWQFKDWPDFYSSPVQLFCKVFGFYVSMEGANVPTDLTQWAVKRATLNRDKRGMDSVTYASFWNGVDEFMSIHKPEMIPQPDA